MGTVTINSVDYDVYSDVATMDTYLAGELSGRVSTLTSLSNDDRGRALIMATRWLDRKAWKGDKTVSSQALQWPRTGATYSDGTEVDSGTIPSEIITAAYELAIIISRDATAAETSKVGVNNTQRLKADTVEIWYHSPVSASEVGDFETHVFELIAQFLESRNTITSGAAYGTDNVTAYEEYSLTQQF